MTVSTIASVASGAIERASGKNTYAASITSLLKVSGASSSASSDTASFSTAISLQTQVSGLRAASLNIAQSASVAEVASVGVGKIDRVLGRLQELAVRASGDVNESTRSALDVEFQALKAEISRITNSANFGGRNVLDGSVSTESLGLEGGEGIPSISAASLFEGADLSLTNTKSAADAVDTLKNALQKVGEVSKNLGSISEALELGAVTVETAIQNQEAARSNLTEADLITASTQTASQQVESASTLSLLAQTNRLPGNVLQLLVE